MHSQDDFEIQFYSKRQNLCVVRPAVEAAAVQFGLTHTEAGEVAMAVDEALANVIRHGYDGREDGLISLRLSAISQHDVGGIKIVIEDQCADVDLDEIRSRNLDEVRPGGLGVHIMSTVMDQVEFKHREPMSTPGVCLTMQKLSKGKPACESE